MEARGPACERLADPPRSPLPLALFPNVTNPRSGHNRAGSHGASNKERRSQEDHSLSSTECLGAQDTRRAVDGAEDRVQQRETAPDTKKAGKRLGQDDCLLLSHHHTVQHWEEVERREDGWEEKGAEGNLGPVRGQTVPPIHMFESCPQSHGRAPGCGYGHCRCHLNTRVEPGPIQPVSRQKEHHMRGRQGGRHVRARPPPSASSPGDKTFPLRRPHVCGAGYGPETHTGQSPRPAALCRAGSSSSHTRWPFCCDALSAPQSTHMGSSEKVPCWVGPRDQADVSLGGRERALPAHFSLL